MKLFKDITIKQKLATFEIPNFDEKISIIKTWHDDYHHGSLKTDKETSRAGGYNQSIFSDVLGYVRKPSPQATFDAEYSLGGKFPDGVLGYFHTDTEKEDNVCAVVELKGAAIPLDQPQKREKNYTPIEQGFGYKRLLRNCPFVIVSNFYELRLYNDNEIDYEVWTLDDLLDPADDYFNFKKFYYLLCAEHLIAETGSSKTESLMSDIRLEEQAITKKFYADYKQRRHWLLQNLYQKNEILRNDPDLLIEMGQKLIDRVIFMCFAEDRGLLPADILQTIKRDFEKSSMVASVWDSLKIAFNYVNKGNENWGIPDGYNGGLFARDDRFDDLKVEGHVLSKIIDFGMYDFADQLSVTILGHIFEQSISDLEEIKEKIEDLAKGDDETTEQKTSKRKKDGIFYTPEYIVDYIVKNSLGAYLREHETKLIEDENLNDELSQREYQKRQQIVYTKYQEFLSQVKVLDPACGSGAFLVRVFDYLLEENRRVGKILGGLFNTDEMYKNILQNNIYGVDLNAESVEITKLSLWLKSAQKGKKLSNLDDNIKCGNSLIDDPQVAGEKAFNWETEFKSILDNGGFDVIVGNPPYGVSFDEKTKQFLINFDSLVPDFEIYIYFISLYKKILKKNGSLSYIFPNTFLSTLFGVKYRSKLFDDISVNEIVDLSQDNTFSDASVRTIIFNIINKKSDYNTQFVKILDKSFIKHDSYNKEIILEEIENIFSLFSQTKDDKKIIEKILRNKPLNEYHNLSQGLIPYDKYRGHDEFTIKNRIWHADYKKDETYKKELKGGDIGSYSLSWNGKLWISYGDWLAAPRDISYFTEPRILVREITSDKLYCCFTKEEYYNTPSLINIIEENKLKLKFTLSILNSSIVGWFHNKTSPKANKGLFPKILVNDIRNIPIPYISGSDQKPFIEKADIMLDLNKKFHEQSSRFLSRMTDNYGLEKANKKIQKFWEMDFGDFVREMRKKGADVPLSTQDELQDYFDKNKSELLELDSHIKSTDREIDAMVYELYGLNDEEIKIIENS